MKKGGPEARPVGRRYWAKKRSPGPFQPCHACHKGPP